MKASKKKPIFDLFSIMLKMLIFSIKTKAYQGYYDWNISYERVFEYGEIYKLIKKEKPENVLDVAGDLSIFGPFVAESLVCKVDIVDMSDLQFTQKIVNKLQPDKRKLVTLYPMTKAENIPYKKYDFITCISSMEHFDDDGDILFVKNAANLLKQNGLLAITSPFTPTDKTIYEYREKTYYEVHGQVQTDEGFYLKKYSIFDIRKLANESGLSIYKLIFAGEIINFNDPFFLYQPNLEIKNNFKTLNKIKIKIERLFSILIKLPSPLYPFLFMRKSDNISDFIIGQKRKKIYCPDVFLLVLKKES